MRRRRFALGVLVTSLTLLPPASGSARPGGGSSFGGSRSSGGSSRSSSSGSSSTRSSSSGSSSTRSSSSGSSSTRSSSSGSSGTRSSSSGSTSSPEHVPVWAIRASIKPAERSSSGPGVSIYGAPPPHAAIAPAPDRRSTADKALSGVVGAGFFAFLAAIVVAPLLIIGAVVRSMTRRKGQHEGWSSAATNGGATSAPPGEAPGAVRRRMEQIRAGDADFSLVLFEDFLAALYTEAQVARGAGTLEQYAPYLRPAARAALGKLPAVPVSPVLVGAMRPVSFTRDDRARVHRVVYEIEANYTETPAGGAPRSFYVAERLTLARALSARSRPPARARALACPSCGAPLARTMRGRCTHCGQAADSGQFDWVIETIVTTAREERGPMLTGTTEEVGTASPTVIDPALQAQLAALKKIDPTLDPAAIAARTRQIFAGMQHAWSSLEWQKARPLLTDRLWNAQTYWIDAYRRQGLRNITEGARIEDIEIVRASGDRYYLGVTVRIHATGLDYTKRDADGAVVGGSRTKERPYTEYWTLVRSVARPPAPGQAPPCPSCGAPLAAQMTERCAYCGALVEASSFDWALSRIEQDEASMGAEPSKPRPARAAVSSIHTHEAIRAGQRGRARARRSRSSFRHELSGVEQAPHEAERELVVEEDAVAHDAERLERPGRRDQASVRARPRRARRRARAPRWRATSAHRATSRRER
ncbi:MAG: Tim44-like domain-containing protein [Byssovorax sp.]